MAQLQLVRGMSGAVNVMVRASPLLLIQRLLSPAARPAMVQQQRFAHARALKLPREIEVEKDKEGQKKKKKREEEEEEMRRSSRNHKKKEAREAVRWGMDLASFPLPRIKRILQVASLEKEVFEALMLVKKFGPDVREGKRRQFNYIGKLLRDAQSDMLGALIQATKDGDESWFQSIADSVQLPDEEVVYESESEVPPQASDDHVTLASKWYDGFINKDIQISNEVYSIDSVEFDRQELRRLVRNVHSIQDRQTDGDQNPEEKAASAAKKSEKAASAAKKSLNRFLTSLAKQFLSSPNVLV